jgi:hypothetical protein
MNNIELNKRKFGLIEGKKITDYIAGSNSPIVRKKLTDGNWIDYKPEHEQQFNYENLYDTLMCVTFATLDALETLFMYHLHKGNISKENVVWLKEKGYFKNGFINFNDRFSAINGGTTSKGAYQFSVIDGIVHKGCIPQDIFPMSSNFSDNIDSKFITEEMYNLGLEFKKRFPILYEWVNNEDVIKFLQYAPLTASVCYDSGQEVLSPNNSPNHRIMVYEATNEFIGVNDSYDELKKYNPSKVYSYMAFYLETKNDMILKKEKGSSAIYLINEDNKTKTMIVDMPTLDSLGGIFEEVDSLQMYSDKGTLIWTERIIN